MLSSPAWKGLYVHDKKQSETIWRKHGDGAIESVDMRADKGGNTGAKGGGDEEKHSFLRLIEEITGKRVKDYEVIKRFRMIAHEEREEDSLIWWHSNKP